MRTLRATFRITTPMFCGSADPKKAELRLGSFKGALRFWWRSLMWGKVSNHAELLKQEEWLFGSSDSRVGQTKVRPRFVRRKITAQEPAGRGFEGGRLKGAHYLGYGVMDFRGQLTRGMIPSGEFEIELALSRLLNDEQTQQVSNALVLLGTVGGLGSKSRKGFGSLSITQLLCEDKPCPLSADPAERLNTVVPSVSPGLPEWTAWSEVSRVVTAKNSGRPVDLLDALGREQVHFRSWGNRGQVLGQDSERNFKADHDLSKGQAVPINHPSRIAFGLPHNYGQGNAKAVGPASRVLDRRASPLFLHIDQHSDSSPPVAVVAFLPARFLPNGEQINAFGRLASLNTGSDFFYPIHAFLDRLKSNGSAPTSRPGYATFPPDSKWWTKKTNLQAQEVHLA